MEFLKHEIFMPEAEPQSGIRRTANHYMTANPVFEQERDDVTRQRLLFSAILCDHFEVLFNGNSNERGPLWEEVRQFMIEQGAMTLVDKDWKYVASCYWQNIRKESIRRMAKMKVGAIKTARPGQLDLDRLVGEVINKRGPGSLESVVNNYGRAYADEEMQNTNTGASNGQPQPAEAKTQQQQIIILEEPLSNSASPAALEEGNNQQPILDQLIRSASLKYTPNQPQTQHQPITVTGPSTSSNSNAGNNFSAGHQQPTAGGRGRDGNVANASAADVVETASFQLGKMVAKTHSLLLGGGYMEMATEFEQQMKQMVNGYKAWMFDQIFPQGNAEEDGLTSGGAGGSADSPPMAKKAKLG